jgi:hypothetical protein
VEDTAQFGVEEGLLPQPIAGGEQLPFPFVVNREGEHPFEHIDAPFAELLVGTQDHLGIALRAEPVALADQPLAERSVVVDLAAEHDPARFIVVGYRLLAGGPIDDRQPAMAEDHVFVGEESGAIGSAMRQGIRHVRHSTAHLG